MEESIQRVSEDECMEREEKIRKGLRTLVKAILMRVFVTCILSLIFFQTSMEPWVICLLLFVVVINLSGMFPLAAEAKKQIRELRSLLDQYQ